MDIIYIATKNKGKVTEFNTFFNKFKISVKSLLDLDDDIIINETGKTFAENALIKAKTLCDLIKTPVLADDSGLEVEKLNNEPGIYSARYAGNHNDLQNNLKVLDKLKGVPFKDRKAYFTCSLALVYPSGKEIVVTGRCLGYILENLQGSDGFGYDPIFYLPELDKSYAELTRSEKNLVSHRGQALKKLEKVLLNDKNFNRE